MNAPGTRTSGSIHCRLRAVTLVASWLAYGVAETQAELDGTAIRAAAERAVMLWPDEPDVEPAFSETRGAITAGTSKSPRDEAGRDRSS